MGRSGDDRSSLLSARDLKPRLSVVSPQSKFDIDTSMRRQSMMKYRVNQDDEDNGNKLLN